MQPAISDITLASYPSDQTRYGHRDPEERQPISSEGGSDFLDHTHSDGGGNFGRLARTGMIDSYMQKLNEVQLCDLKTIYWRQFLKAFQKIKTGAQASLALERLRQRIQQTTDIPSPKAQSALPIVAQLERLLDIKK